MGRIKDPEQTYESILDTASKLFIEKGYEQTNIQDILNALDLSKGGLYHHFKSKEEILEAVMQRQAQYVTEMFQELIKNTTGKNAREKLKKILCHLGTDTQAHSLDPVLSSQISNPHFVVNGLQTCVKLDAPIVGRLIEEGVADGSLRVTQPLLCAEIFLMLLNIWLNPVLFGRSFQETRERLYYLQQFMSTLGLDIIDDEFMSAILGCYDNVKAEHT